MAPESATHFVNAWSDVLVEQLMTFVFAYALILTITYRVNSRDKMARQMTETARLNEELSRAQLSVLRAQMDPHFMFNTLNSIASLVVDQRRDAAVGMIVGLSEFLHRASEDSHRAQVTLREEVEYLQRYMNIQKVRFRCTEILKTGISPEMKLQASAIADREFLSEAAWLRRLVIREIRARSDASDAESDLLRPETIPRPTSASSGNDGAGKPMLVRLTTEDKLLLDARAEARGMRPATFASVLLRSHLRQLTPLPKDELLSLKRSVAELGSIG